jgi:hypothetical protein
MTLADVEGRESQVSRRRLAYDDEDDVLQLSNFL